MLSGKPLKSKQTKALNWDLGKVESAFGFAKDFLCDLGQLMLPPLCMDTLANRTITPSFPIQLSAILNSARYKGLSWYVYWPSQQDSPGSYSSEYPRRKFNLYSVIKVWAVKQFNTCNVDCSVLLIKPTFGFCKRCTSSRSCQRTKCNTVTLVSKLGLFWIKHKDFSRATIFPPKIKDAHRHYRCEFVRDGVQVSITSA